MIRNLIREELKKYIGKEFNEEIKKQIEAQFKSYTVTTCSLDRFYCEDYWDVDVEFLFEIIL